jgi:acetyl-CoA carboxylase alpha subunit
MPENKPIVKEDVAEKDLVLSRTSKIIDKLIEDDEVLKEVDKTKMMESLSALIEKSPQKLMSITDDGLTRRIEKTMLIEAMSGMFSGLNPAQMKAYEAAVKRRELF